MSERAGLILALLLGAAITFAVALTAGLAGVGGPGLVGLAVMTLGVLTACVFYLSELQQLPIGALLLGALTLATLTAVLRALAGLVREQRLLRALPLEPIDGRLAQIANQAGVRVFRTPARHAAAFCVGLRAPRVVVTDGLLERLEQEELAAVIWHEAAHARGREPLARAAARFAVQAFAWMPLLRGLLARYCLLREIEADRLATRRTSRRALAGALCAVFGEPAPAGAVGFAELAPARIDRLLDPASPLPRVTSTRSLVWSVLALLVLAGIVALPTQFDASGSMQLRPMLTSMSMHGLPGMAAGLVLNLLMLGGLLAAVRRRGRRRLPVG
jgi:Zn-dependent protease with chaperone function